MMNQKGVINIILSAILLYLYYRRRDIAIFVGFIVVVVGTLILGKGGEEGFGMGGGKKGGGGIDKDCAEMGFTQPKIDKKDINGSLEKAMKNIEKVAETKWPFEKGDIEGKRTEDKTVEANWKVIMESTFLKDWSKGIGEKKSKENKELDALMDLWAPAEALYKKFILRKSTDEEKSAVVNEYNVNLDKIIKSGPIVIEFINNLKNSDEIKDADDGVKDILNYITSFVKHWISIITGIIKSMKSAGGGKKKTKPADDDEDAGAADDDEKPKKKKKKKSAEEEDEDEKPEKKATKKKKPAVADDE
jgi:hypothetical protein